MSVTAANCHEVVLHRAILYAWVDAEGEGSVAHVVVAVNTLHSPEGAVAQDVRPEQPNRTKTELNP